MARRDNTFVLVAAGLGVAAWVLFRPKRTGAAPATHQNGAAGGGVSGSPNQVVLTPGVTVPIDWAAAWRVGV